jgi:hypothetical protein
VPSPPASDPAAVAKSFNDFRSALGHHGLGRADSPYNEHLASLVLIHHDALVHTLQATAPAPPPFSPQPSLGNPFDLLPLSCMLASLKDKAPGASGFIYSMLKSGGHSLLSLLHHHLSRLWQLHSPLTVNSSLTQHPTSWALHLLAPIYKDGKVPPLDRLHSKNYRGIHLGDAVPMVFQMGLLDSLSDYVSQHNLLTSAQGACLSSRQPFDTVYALLSYIQHRHKHHRQPTFVFFGDISLAFPSVFREQLLLRLHAYGIPNDIRQHLPRPTSLHPRARPPRTQCDCSLEVKGGIPSRCRGRGLP